MPEAMIRLQGVSGGYGGHDVIRELELTVGAGAIDCIVGPNGAGKSTVLKMVSGLLTPRAGSVMVNDLELVGKSPAQILKAGVVQVPQRYGLFARLTVRENVLMGGYVIRNDRRRVKTRYEELSAMFPIIDAHADKRADSLSGGQRRIVEFARAMMLDPFVVLLDEPTLGLDPRNLALIRESTIRMNQAGVTILMVEQNVRFGLGLATRATVMSAGQVALTGSASAIASHPDLTNLFFGLAPGGADPPKGAVIRPAAAERN
jgi:ABC-type branched-subunit amino acid transport system ATPase component